jgi:hypothetical protein
LGEPAGALVAEQAVEVEGLVEVHSIHEVGQLAAARKIRRLLQNRSAISRFSAALRADVCGDTRTLG